MKAFISHNSAIEFWRQQGRPQKGSNYRRSWKKLPAYSPESSIVRRGNPWGLSVPLDVIINNSEARRPSRVIRPHVCSIAIPDGSFVDAGNGLYVSSPEFCFFQMASELPRVKLIELGIELCGTYSLPGDAVDTVLETAEKTLYNLPPLTDRKKMSAFLAHMKGGRGQRQALWALKYIVDKSASPMETILVMLLALPYKHGGYGLPMPELNRRIDLGKLVKKSSSKEFLRCDLYWEDAGLIVEYDSDLYHSGPKQIAEDAKRRNALTSTGVRIITVTNQQIHNAIEFDKVARLISANMGRRLNIRNKGFVKARRELRSSLHLSLTY